MHARCLLSGYKYDLIGYSIPKAAGAVPKGDKIRQVYPDVKLLPTRQ
jgi:hypothetical protein